VFVRSGVSTKRGNTFRGWCSKGAQEKREPGNVVPKAEAAGSSSNGTCH
jgi:hypothetical protein